MSNQNSSRLLFTKNKPNTVFKEILSISVIVFSSAIVFISTWMVYYPSISIDEWIDILLTQERFENQILLYFLQFVSFVFIFSVATLQHYLLNLLVKKQVRLDQVSENIIVQSTIFGIPLKSSHYSYNDIEKIYLDQTSAEDKLGRLYFVNKNEKKVNLRGLVFSQQEAETIAQETFYPLEIVDSYDHEFFLYQ